MVENVEYGGQAQESDGRLAQVAAERHPEAFAGELPESWAGREVNVVTPPEQPVPVRGGADW